jgi:hypothetical protein
MCVNRIIKVAKLYSHMLTVTVVRLSRSTDNVINFDQIVLIGTMSVGLGKMCKVEN